MRRVFIRQDLLTEYSEIKLKLIIMATQDFGSMEYGSGGNVPNIPAPAKVNHSSSPTMGHYREHIETNKSAGVKHLGDESAGNSVISWPLYNQDINNRLRLNHLLLVMVRHKMDTNHILPY